MQKCFKIFYYDDCAVIYYVIVFLTDFTLYFFKMNLGKMQDCYRCLLKNCCEETMKNYLLILKNVLFFYFRDYLSHINKTILVLLLSVYIMCLFPLFYF